MLNECSWSRCCQRRGWGRKVISYVVRTGCAWRQLPKNFAPWPTVYRYLTWWHDDGTAERIHDALRGKVRKTQGPASNPARPPEWSEHTRRHEAFTRMQLAS
ncbi:transposase [Streptomyces sp. NPDC091268]|uniref:transposase n=1 Tax=Streptomyces sp. NPDC091268 TaxID=3365979 RepID=UPI00381AE778